jgi:large subunit ribosomal protein L29
MARTNVNELRNMETEELENRLSEVRQEQFNLRFQLVTGQLDNYARVGQVRRDVARMETILREREIAAAEQAEAAEAAAAAAQATATPASPEERSS